MRYYLSPFVGNGTFVNGFQPTADEFNIIDLRGDSTSGDGWCLLRTPEKSPHPLLVDLGDDLDEPMPKRVARKIEDSLRLTLDSAGRLRGIIVELMLRHATGSHDHSRWNRVSADSRGRHRIVLGELVYDAPQILNVTDDFNRANEELEVSGNWDVSDTTDFTVVSNQLDVSPGGTSRTAHWSADTFGPNMFVQADYVTAGAQDVGVILRFDGTNHDNLYMARDNGANYDIAKYVAAVFTRLGTGGDGTTGLFRFEADGSTLTLHVDSVQEVQVTDTALTGAGFAGFIGDSGDGGVWDDFKAGELGKNRLLLLGVP